jgi:16S rRNA (cytosine967-C5)-methyltransferase
MMAPVTAARKEAAKILYRVEKGNAFADILIHDKLNKNVLSGQDKALLHEIVTGTLRWKKRLDYILSRTVHDDWRQAQVKLKIILEIGLYQMLYLQRIPVFAVINESVELAKTWGQPRWSGLVNAVLRRLSNVPDDLLWSDSENKIEKIAVDYSYPEWLISRWIQTIGEERTKKLCQINNEKAGITLRVNHLKSEKETVAARLQQQGYDVSKCRYLNDYLKLQDTGDLFQSQLFREGFVTVQDESAGISVHLLDPQPGELILDMAAAPGGKTSYIHEMTMGKAQIVAMDRSRGRLNRLVDTFRRLKYPIPDIIQGDGTACPVKWMDKILIDAPCSGLGVLRKKIELRWKMQESRITGLSALQKRMLAEAVKLLKPGGVIVYSTCTTTTEENEAVVEWFLNQYQNFQIESGHRWVPGGLVHEKGWIKTWTDLHDMDGSFSVRLIKTR